jgi:hypothetical protein
MSRGSDPLTIDKFRSLTAIIGVTTVSDFRPDRDRPAQLIFTKAQTSLAREVQCSHTKAQAQVVWSDQFVHTENRSDGGSDG